MASSGGDASEFDPPLNEEEMKMFLENKAECEAFYKETGRKLIYDFPNDPDWHLWEEEDE